MIYLFEFSQHSAHLHGSAAHGTDTGTAVGFGNVAVIEPAMEQPTIYHTMELQTFPLICSNRLCVEFVVDLNNCRHYAIRSH